MTFVQCSDLQLILLTIFVIFLIVLMEQIAEYFYFKKDSSSMKIKIVSARLTCFFNMEWHPSFAGEVRYFIMYKKHWWQKYRYLKGWFGIPMKFNSQEAAEEYLKKNGIDYKGK